MFLKPDFFDSFRCKASECTDSCCIGWEIDIDSNSLEKYNSVEGEFGKRLRNNISTEDDCSYFTLCKGDRCPFLNEDNLCDIYINMGEESLCDICKEHPRFYNEFAGRCEAGIGLCCERVCEIIFADDSPLRFILENDGYDDDFDFIEEDAVTLRQKIFDIAGDRSIGFFNRIRKLTEFDLNDDNLRQIVDIFAHTEPINGEWSEYINDLMSAVDELLSVQAEFNDSHYEKLFIHIVYRHFIKSVFDGETDRWLFFCIVNLFFIHIMDRYTLYINGKYTLQDRINNVKLWSKQIEYSEENIEYIKNEMSDCI